MSRAAYLADVLDNMTGSTIDWRAVDAASQELRRLQAENAELLKALQEVRANTEEQP